MTPLTKEGLLRKLRQNARYLTDAEQAHADADYLLLRYINDPDITAAFDATSGKWNA